MRNRVMPAPLPPPAMNASGAAEAPACRERKEVGWAGERKEGVWVCGWAGGRVSGACVAFRHTQ